VSLTPLVFTGVSKYSSDFQTILERTVKIASLPITSLQNQQKDLVQRKVVASGLQGAVAAFGASLKSLGEIGDRRAVTGRSTNTAKVAIRSVTASTGGVYQLSKVTSIATAAAETSFSSYPDSNATAVSATGMVQLKVGENTFTVSLTPGENNLAGLRDKINGLGAGVTASILTTAGANYLSISANTTGETTLSLKDDPGGAATDLLSAANQGTNAVFELNGVPVSQKTNLVNSVIPGLSFEVLGTTDTDEKVSLTLASDRTQLSTALSSLADSYNALVGQVDGQIGESAGLLSGSSLVREIQSVLREVTGFSGSGDVKSLSGIGLVFNSSNKLTFDASIFAGLTDAQVRAGLDFSGNSEIGLGSLSRKVTAISDPVTGLIQAEINQYNSTGLDLDQRVSALNERVTLLQSGLAQRLQAADSLMATLEAQQSVLTASIDSLSYSLFGKRNG
jgi:flagellar hook-associated protein 2